MADIQESQGFKDWLFKQAPVIVVLIVTNLAQYNYFTRNIADQRLEYMSQINKLEAKVDVLQDRILELHKK